MSQGKWFLLAAHDARREEVARLSEDEMNAVRGASFQWCCFSSDPYGNTVWDCLPPPSGPAMLGGHASNDSPRCSVSGYGCGGNACDLFGGPCC